MTAPVARRRDQTPGIDAQETPAVARMIDPRAVRVAAAGAAASLDVAPLVVEPPAVPVAPAPRIAGTGVLGGVAPAQPLADDPPDPPDLVLVDGLPLHVRLERRGAIHAGLVVDGAIVDRTSVLMPPAEASGGGPGFVRREIVVDGWRVEVDLESERRAALRERARRGREEQARGGPTEVRAIIPGQVISVSVAAGDPVDAGQQLLVVEAMKMQNELRAPRDGTVERVAVGAGQTIEVGDLLLVLE
jgi:biotin carboxyl carrier protein